MIAYYVMVKLQFGNQPAFWHPAFECESEEEANETIKALPKRYGEIGRTVIEARAGDDYREMRPC